MAQSITGDFAKLEQMRAAIVKAGSPAYLASVNKNLAEAAVTEIKLGFSESMNPYGEPWAPLKSRKGQPLRDTGRLANSFRRTTVGAGGFTITSGVGYGAYHQDGVDSSKSFTRVNAHSASGKFLSKKAAVKSKKAVRVSFATHSGVHIPARKMVPDGVLPPRYVLAFQDVLEEMFEQLF